MSIQTLLISLILCLFACSAFGAIGEDFVSFVWDAAGSKSLANGGGATRAVWEGGSPQDFMDTATGAAIVSKNALVVENQGGEIALTDLGANGWFTDIVTGTITQLANYSGDDTTDGFFVATKHDNDTIILDGTTYVDDATETGDLDLGGVCSGLAAMVGSDLMDGSSVNCDVLIKGNETTGEVTVAGGGGTTTTLLRLLGVDTSWDRIVPTRTTASGGSKANYLLDTSAMPTVTLGTDYMLFDVDYVQVDGLYFTGTRQFGMVGSTTGDQQIYSNCVFDNASTENTAITLLSDNNATFFNCDVIASGASGNTISMSVDNAAHIFNCRIVNNSNSATSIGIDINSGEVIGCVFYKIDGIGTQYNLASTQWVVGYCTFYDVIKPVTTPDVASTVYAQIFNNVAEAAGGTETFIDNLYSGTRKVQLFAAFNQLYNFGTTYNNYVGEQGFQDLSSDPLFVSEANNNYNLQATSPGKNSGPFLENRGAMSDAEAGGDGNVVIIRRQ